MPLSPKEKLDRKYLQIAYTLIKDGEVTEDEIRQQIERDGNDLFYNIIINTPHKQLVATLFTDVSAAKMIKKIKKELNDSFGEE